MESELKRCKAQYDKWKVKLIQVAHGCYRAITQRTRDKNKIDQYVRAVHLLVVADDDGYSEKFTPRADEATLINIGLPKKRINEYLAERERSPAPPF